jgi:hypothetical protein
MDLQLYYKKIRDLEQDLKDPSVVLVSHDTPDGGREGRRTEAPRSIAAKMIVEGTARVATPEEARQFQKEKVEAKRKADQLAASSRLKFAVLTQSELSNLKGGERAGGE